MEQELIDFINNRLAVADLRNLSPTNPVVFEVTANGITAKVVVSHTEPDYRSYPFNVIWLPAAPASADRGKALRRTGKNPTGDYKDTWVELLLRADITAEAPVYDSSTDNTFQIGELGLAVTFLPATTIRHGLAKLATAAVDPADAIAVETNDPRLSNDRAPVAHVHPVLPFPQLVAGNGATVSITGGQPLAGQALKITTENSPTEFEAQWVWIYQSDVAYSGPSFDSLSIIGPATVNESTTASYQAQATFSDNSTQIVGATWSITDGAANGSINAAGQLTTNDITGNSTITLTATFTHPASNVTQTTTQVVNVTDTTVPITLSSIAINGPTTVNESASHSYTVVATYSDSSTQVVTPDTFTSSNAAAGTFTGGTLTVPALTSNQVTELAAAYTQSGTTVNATLQVTATDNTLYPSSIAITGNASMNESSSQTLVATATYTDNSTAQVTGTWSNSNSTAGTINASTGEYTANAVTADESDTITVTYDVDGTTVTNTFAMTVTDVPVTFDSITIGGPATVNESATAQYSVTGNFSDSSTQDLTASTTWSITVGGAHASISSSGLVTANAVTSNQQVTISASTVSGGVTQTATRVITVEDVPLTPIYGAAGENTSVDSAWLQANLGQSLPSTADNQEITLNLTTGQWGWAAIPTALSSNVKFTDTSNNFQGGWDGATWPNGSSYSPNTGPQTVTHLGQSWVVYRTDYSALGNKTFRLTW